MNKLRKGDEVIVITGKYKGERGRIVERVDEDHLVVEGVNQVIRHTKPNPAKNTTGGKITKTMPIHQSNVAIFNSTTGKADRVGFRVSEVTEGDKTTLKKVRVFRSTGAEIANTRS